MRTLQFVQGTRRSVRGIGLVANGALRRSTMVGNFGRRNVTTYFQQPPPKSSRTRWIVTGLAIVGLVGAWKWYTSHNYPPEVANKLRKALYEELKTSPNYKLALQYYLEALEEADLVQMNPMSDEYTGLQIKIAEMYEKLGMEAEARLLYRELGTAYVQALADGTSISGSIRPHMIQRQLRVALKTAMYEAKENANVAKMGLLVHFLLAQKEVVARDPELRDLIEGVGEKAAKEGDKRTINLTLLLDENHDPKNKSGKHHSDAWEPFRDELFSARDMFVALCIATGDIGLALKTKLNTTEWMAVAGCDIGEVLMSFYNVGSIFYLQSEELELLEWQNKEKEKQAKEEDATTNTGNVSQADALSKQMIPRNLAQDSINNAESCYDVIIKVVDQLPGKTRRESKVAEAHALSIYGLGVIALHQSKLDKAKDLLREARLRAKGCEFEDLVKSSELELEKLEKLEKEIASGKQPEYEGPSIDVVFLKHDQETGEMVQDTRRK